MGNSVESALITMLGGVNSSHNPAMQKYGSPPTVRVYNWEVIYKICKWQHKQSHLCLPQKSHEIRVQSFIHPINIYCVPSTTLNVRKTKINRYSPCLWGVHSLAGEKDAQINKCKIIQLAWIYLFKYDYSTGVIHFKHKQIPIGSPTCSTWQTCYLS